MSKAPNVVIVDAHPAEQALLRYVLSHNSISSTAFSPRASLDVLAGSAPDLAIIDAGNDLGGVALCRALRQRVPGVLTVLISDVSTTELRHSSGSLGGADAVLVRPLSRQTIEPALVPLLARAVCEPSRKRVMVIDDDEDVLRVVSKILGNAGCDVTTVTDPRSILRMTPSDYDLVLLDVVMPELDGLTVCQALRRSAGDDLRICMMTASHDPESVRAATLSGADGYLTKPIRSQELLALVGRVRLEPFRKRAEPAGALAAARAKVAERRKHVLVVDDDRDILEYVRTVFGYAGVDVDAIQDPSHLRDSLPTGGSYDLVLLDIFMPAVDGIELLRRFCADVKNLSSRFYIITAEEDEAMRTLARESGADGFLTKPLGPRALLDLLVA
ncbi:MAG TPA: response regulator [Myxococcales bacterium]|nr:response regulator [Myxococcales bacterium]